MSVRAVSWAYRQRIASQSLKGALVAVATKCDGSGVTTASQALIAKEAGVGIRQIKRHLAALEQLGMLKRTIRSRGGKGRATDLIRLLLEASFDIARGDIPRDPTSSSKVTSKSRCEALQGDITPHLVQGDTNVTAIRSLISKGSAKPKSRQPNQGVSAARRSAKTGDAIASVEGVPPTSKLPPPGTKSARPSKGGVYARHRASLDRLTRGTVH